MSTRRSRAARPQLPSLVFGFALVACGMAMAGCASTPETRPAAIEVPRTVSAATILRPPAVDPEVEIDSVARVKTIPALLRRAYLELVCRRPQAAVDAAAEVLYGIEKPGANEEAFARFLRAEGYAMQGKADRGTYDLDRARALALDAELQRMLGKAPVAAEPPPHADVPLALSVHARSEWSPRSIDRRNLEAMGTPHRVTIHHSAMYFRDTGAAACAAQIQQIQREHMGNRGYGDIGYHYLIDPAGRIWEGRELRWQGAHASGDNNIQNIGICVLGNFLRGRGGQSPSQAQVQSMRQLVRQLGQRYQFGAGAIHCHSDFKPTQCPGPLMEAVVAQLVRDMRSDGPRFAAATAGP